MTCTDRPRRVRPGASPCPGPKGAPGAPLARASRSRRRRLGAPQAADRPPLRHCASTPLQGARAHSNASAASAPLQARAIVSRSSSTPLQGARSSSTPLGGHACSRSQTHNHRARARASPAGANVLARARARRAALPPAHPSTARCEKITFYQSCSTGLMFSNRFTNKPDGPPSLPHIHPPRTRARALLCPPRTRTRTLERARAQARAHARRHMH